MTLIQVSISKWWQTIKLFWANIFTYRMDFFLQVIAPGLVFLFIKYNLWAAIYKGTDQLVIANHTFEQMIQYQMWSMLVLLLTVGHRSMDLAEDIRMGRISAYLIYPMNFWEHHTASFFAFQAIQSFIFLFTLMVFIFFKILIIPSLSALVLGYLYCLLVSLLWFLVQYASGLLAFWLEETWMIRVMIHISTLFLSGGFLPLTFFPEKFTQILLYTPFPYLAYYPIKIFSGDITDIAFPSLVVAIWMTFGVLINKFLWKKGLKLYTAAGM